MVTAWCTGPGGRSQLPTGATLYDRFAGKRHPLSEGFRLNTARRHRKRRAIVMGGDHNKASTFGNALMKHALRRPAGSERPGLKLGRRQPLFHSQAWAAMSRASGAFFSIHALRPSVWAFI